MYAIVSLLEVSADARIQAIWRDLETECQLKGIRITPIPHFSWQIAENYDLPALKKVLRQIAATTRPFVVRTAGLGIFTRPDPVIYIALTKDQTMLNLHDLIWNETQNIVRNLGTYYASEYWMPHITIAYSDVNPKNIGCALNKLAFQSLEWEIKINNLALVYQLADQVGKLNDRFEFTG